MSGEPAEKYTRRALRSGYIASTRQLSMIRYYLTTQMQRWGGRRVADCSGLIQAFRGQDDTAHGLMQKCGKVGPLKDFDGSIGRLVFCAKTGRADHVGIMIGGGYVIHSTSSEKGVIKERLSTSTRGWTHYGIPVWIDYSFTRPKKKITAKSSVNDICWLQDALNKTIGAKLVVDGEYGQKTSLAVVSYRKKIGLYQDTITGITFHEKLIKLLAAGDVTYQGKGDYIGRLVKPYESGSKGSLCLESCGNDWGLSCGSYQLTLRWGNCIHFLKKYFPEETKSLYFKDDMPGKAQKAWPGKEYCSSPAEVKMAWQKCYKKVGTEQFFKYEHEYIRSIYYDPVLKGLKEKYGYVPGNRAMQECIWSWSVHRGVAGMLREFGAIYDKKLTGKQLFENCYDERYKNFPYPRYATGKGSERVLLRRHLDGKMI